MQLRAASTLMVTTMKTRNKFVNSVNRESNKKGLGCIQSQYVNVNFSPIYADNTLPVSVF